MKYPAEQFETLVQTLTVLNEYFNLSAIHPSNLHYLAYTQFSDGLTHNQFYIKNGEIRRHYFIENIEGWQKLVHINKPFELYPAGCNDDHIETAVKRALKKVSVGVSV